MLHEREVPLGLRGDAKPKPPIAVVLGDLAAPLVEAERRIGDHPVVEQQLPLMHQLGVPDGVALLDPGVRQPVEEHVHLADGPGAEIPLLALEGEILRVPTAPLDVVSTLDQHAARAHGRVANPHPLGRRKQLND